MEIKITEINKKQFNPFSATAEELVANALHEAGLLTATAKINDLSGIELCQNFHQKRQNYKKMTRIGSILIQSDVISQNELKDALEFQKKQPKFQIGETLVNMNLCSKEDLSKSLHLQKEIRSNIKTLEQNKENLLSV